MAAYIISRVDVKDPERMKDYAARSIALAKTYGATYPVRTNRVEALEGTYDGRRLIVIQFPDLARARARVLGFARISGTAQAAARGRRQRALAGAGGLTRGERGRRYRPRPNTVRHAMGEG